MKKLQEIKIDVKKTVIKDVLFNVRNLDRSLDFLDFSSIEPKYKAVIIDSLGNICEKIENYLITDLNNNEGDNFE